MSLLGDRLNNIAPVLPIGGWLSKVLPLLAIIGIITFAFDFGFPEIEKAIAGIGMFANGIVLSGELPVWKRVSEDELAQIMLRREKGPHGPWIRAIRQYGWLTTAVIFMLVVAVLVVGSGAASALIGFGAK